MGCDIHFFTEHFTSSNNYLGPRDITEDRNTKIEEIIEGKTQTEKWVSADEWEIHDGEWSIQEKYYNRNYYLFSLLADVRNTGEEPIDYPRGIPQDASLGYLYKCNQWEGDAHSHSYYTLKELLEVDWNNYDLEYLEEFLDVLEDLKSIDNDYSKVRICFFFDN